MSHCSPGQKSGHAWQRGLGSQRRSASWARLLSEGFGKGSASKLIQIVGIFHFLWVLVRWILLSLLAIRKATQLQDAPAFLVTCPPFIFNAGNGSLNPSHTNLSDVFYHEMENTLLLKSSLDWVKSSQIISRSTDLALDLHLQNPFTIVFSLLFG